MILRSLGGPAEWGRLSFEPEPEGRSLVSSSLRLRRPAPRWRGLRAGASLACCATRARWGPCPS
eukprot:951484-Rhodomonas_salina.3